MGGPLEDVARLTMLSVSGNKNAIRVVIKGEDDVKLCCMTSDMTALKMSGKSAYATWLSFADEGEASQSRYVVEALLTYWLCFVSRVV